MYSLAKKLLFSLDAEKAHNITMDALPLIVPFLKSSKIENPVTIQGLRFKNRIGLAAGFDKNGLRIDEWAAMGFGHVEVGTVTPKPQPGNPKPRLFRLPEDEAIINRMGFNNEGLKAICTRLEKRKSDIVVGGNIGKNKVTANENAHQDYLKCFIELFDLVDYFTVNVSSPNTPGLRALQEKDALTKILDPLNNERYRRNTDKPIFLKIAPDLLFEDIDKTIEVIRESQLSGLVLTNTTISREDLKTKKQTLDSIGAGGLSGAPLTQKSSEILSYVKKRLNSDTFLISVGGIMDSQEAKNRLELGASLVQIYTGFIYNGPDFIIDLLQDTKDC